jgi:hypothetical protein
MVGKKAALEMVMGGRMTSDLGDLPLGDGNDFPGDVRANFTA